MTLTLTGKTVTTIGRVLGRSRADIASALDAHGATLAPAPRAGIDVALVGANPSRHKIDRARILGCVMVHGADIDTLLDEGELDVAPQTEELAHDGLISEARSALARRPGAESWERITSLVDACAPERLDALLAYLEPQLTRWPLTEPILDAVWYEHADAPPTRDPMFGRYIRTAPRSWLLDMMGGRTHPKHRLANAIDLKLARISDRESRKLFGSTNGHVLALRVGDVKSSSFYRELASVGSLENLEVLELSGRVGADALAPLAKASPGALPSLRALDPGAGTAALEGDWGERVKEVSIRDPAQYLWVTAHGDELERVTTRPPRRAANPKKIAKSIQRAIGRFTRAVFSEESEPWGGATLSAFAARMPAALTEIDVSRCPSFHPANHERVARVEAQRSELRVTRDDSS